MPDWLQQHWLQLHFLSLFGTLLAVSLAESFFAARPQRRPIARRWFSNIALVFLNRAFAAWALPVSMLGVAAWASREGFGLFQWLDLPPGLALPLEFLALDLANYTSHRIHHRVPALWRLHRVHHSDPELDFSTAHRVHPLGLLTSSAIQLGGAAMLGVSVTAVVATFLVRPAMDAFLHGNLELPQALDRTLRDVIVTPGVHAIHHSAHRESTDRNYGGIVTWWDRLFGTWRGEPEAGWRPGLDGFRDPRDVDLDRILLQPLRSEGHALPAASLVLVRGVTAR